MRFVELFLDLLMAHVDVIAFIAIVHRESMFEWIFRVVQLPENIFKKILEIRDYSNVDSARIWEK